MEIHLICDEIKPGQSGPEGQSYLPLHVRDKTVCYCLTDGPWWRVEPLQADPRQQQPCFVLYKSVNTKPHFFPSFFVHSLVVLKLGITVFDSMSFMLTWKP